MAERKPVPSRTRFAVFTRDRFRCHYCGATGGMAQLHADHIVPVSKGGSDDTTNLITACANCNLGKSDAELGRDVMPVPRPAKVRRSRRRKIAKPSYPEWNPEPVLYWVKTREESEAADRCTSFFGELLETIRKQDPA